MRSDVSTSDNFEEIVAVDLESRDFISVDDRLSSGSCRSDDPDTRTSSDHRVVAVSEIAVVSVENVVSLLSHQGAGQQTVVRDTVPCKKIGVATCFRPAVEGTRCPRHRPKSSDSVEVSRHTEPRGSRSSTSRRQEPPSTSSSSSSSYSSSGSVPDGYMRVARCLPAHTSERDEQRLVANCRQLENSQFYVAELTSTEAKRRLRGDPPGTFLVRDSAHPRHLYSLTVKTERGVTSIRTVYDEVGFRLDSDPDQICLMPAFESVVALVSHYVEESRAAARGGDGGGDGGRQRSSCVFVDRSGRRDLPVILKTPYRSRPASLRHLSRLTINSALDGREVDRLCLVPTLRDFLREHPFRV